MRMDGQEESDNVEDVRGMGGGGGGGGFSFGGGRGIGLGTVAIALIAGWIFGINPLTLLGALSGDGGSPVVQQTPERLDRPVPAAREPAQLVVQLARAVEADRDHQAPDAARQRPLDERDRFVAEPAGGREVQQKHRAAAALNRRDEIVEIAAHEQLAAGEVHPAELGPPAEELCNLGRRHLVHALLLPDVAHLTAEVAVIRRDKCDFVRELRRAEIGSEDRLTQADFFD